MGGGLSTFVCRVDDTRDFILRLGRFFAMKVLGKQGLLAVILLVSLLHCHGADAQKISIKTNALYWATTSPNLSAEVALAPQWTFEVGGGLNPFTFKGNRKWKHYQWQGEARYWFDSRFYGHFMGLHAGGGEMNVVGASCPWPRMHHDKRYDGWAVKAGLSYGYSFEIGENWNLEAQVGLGVIHADYGMYGCIECADLEGYFSRTMFAPTRLGLSFVYLIR